MHQDNLAIQMSLVTKERENLSGGAVLSTRFWTTSAKPTLRHEEQAAEEYNGCEAWRLTCGVSN